MKGKMWIGAFLLVGFGCVACAQESPKLNQGSLKATSITSGSEMFATYCAVCHGTSGKGDGPAASALKKKPADLTQLSKNNGGRFPALKAAGYIRGDEVLASHGSRDMPIWGKLFRETDGEKLAGLRIHNLTQYLETLQEK